ncbi:zinc finger FYVE domain-containing protein 9 isoform X2 [Electrophorus electricus]|uniref:zinc finger FYVE domain-containing protein 9 isoform X2 n=1 Tax=Electrophorus electricus TaxID=8005 RepID=UPI0015CFF80A|nr:zinc finger FYVE domain-containing protein 9 isoform X2 [Electrophorus electricus]
MRQAVSATLSVWGERRLGYSTLNDSREALLDEGWLTPGLKEDSVIEEKEVADSEQEQQEALVARSPSTPEDALCLPQTQGEGAQPEAAMPISPHTSESPSAHSVYSTNGPGPGGGASDRRRGSLVAPPMQCCTSLGSTAPQWVPDSHAPACMKCGSRFSFTRRRHHCRACGKVFCVVCCDLRFRLTHLGGKEGRVCVTCHSTLINRTLRKEQKKVWFADSVLPRNEASSVNTSPTRRDSSQTHPPTAAQVESTHVSEELNSACLEREEVENSPKRNTAKPLSHKGLPPILTSTGIKGDYTVEEKRTESSLLEELEQGLTEPLVFVLNANLLAMVKIVSYMNRRCWCVMSKGMHAVGQPEVVVLLQCLPEEKRFPTDIFSHFIQIYWDAQTGKLLNHLSHSSAARGFLGGSEHAGFLYVRPTFQSLDGLPLPPQPFLFGLLVLRAELPWARAFPLRLLLRLGAEYRFYPCPLFSVRFREPLFGQIRNSIMRLLVDFRFYRYTLPVVTGMMVDLEARSTFITIPKTRHAELLKVLNRSIERILAMAACFNERADSHLICVQTADGEYQTQAISIHSQPRRVTGSCFFVFSGSLKASSGYLAKSSIVEDGLMVQVTMETMLELRRALRDMRDFTLTCGKLHQSDRQEYVHIRWQDEEPCFNKGIISPIDGKSMESITCVKTCQRLEYRATGKVIRWTEVFFLQKEKQVNGHSRDANQKRLTEQFARAFCLTLCQSLCLLKEDGMSKLGLRITLDGQKVRTHRMHRKRMQMYTCQEVKQSEMGLIQLEQRHSVSGSISEQPVRAGPFQSMRQLDLVISLVMALHDIFELLVLFNFRWSSWQGVMGSVYQNTTRTA